MKQQEYTQRETVYHKIILFLSIMNMCIMPFYIGYVFYLLYNRYKFNDAIWISIVALSFICYMITAMITALTKTGICLYRHHQWMIKLMLKHCIVPRVYGMKLLSRLLWQSEDYMQSLRDLGYYSAEYIEPSAVGVVTQFFYNNHPNTTFILIEGIHSFLQSVILSFMVNYYYYHQSIFLLISFIVIFLLFIDFVFKSSIYLSLILPQFHWKSFLFLWFCVITDYVRLLLTISCLSHCDDTLNSFWKYNIYTVCSLVAFIVICLSFTHSLDRINNDCCFLFYFIFYWIFLWILYIPISVVLTELFCFTWIGVIIYWTTIKRFDGYYFITESNILHELILFLYDSQSNKDEKYRIFAINKHCNVECDKFDNKLNEWIDKVVQTQRNDISYKHIKRNCSNSEEANVSKHIQYKSLFYLLITNYPIDFSNFGIVPSLMNIFFIFPIIFILLPLYILSRIFLFFYPFIVLYNNYNINEVIPWLLLISYFVCFVILVILMAKILFLYHKLWYIAVGCCIDDISRYPKLSEVQKEYDAIKSYELAYNIIFKQYGPDIGRVIMDCYNDSFLSHRVEQDLDRSQITNMETQT